MDNVAIVGGTDAEPELVVFDFDLAGDGYAVADFPFGSPHWEHFLSGYAEVRPLAPEDLGAEPWLDAVEVLAGLRFHLVTKPRWRGTESLGEGWLDQTLADLRDLAAALPTG
ncbi:hypothetical protein [Longispora urticae]